MTGMLYAPVVAYPVPPGDAYPCSEGAWAARTSGERTLRGFTTRGTTLGIALAHSRQSKIFR